MSTTPPDLPEDAIIGSPTEAEIVFLGPAGVGKTTAVAALSSIPPINTEVRMVSSTDAQPVGKITTTVGVDYGMWFRPDGSIVGIFGTPGQDRFVHARATLANPDAGIVVWLYGDDEDIAAELRHWFAIANGTDNAHRMTVALNFSDAGIATVQQTLRELGAGSVPVLAADARVKESVAEVCERVLRYAGTLSDEDGAGGAGAGGAGAAAGSDGQGSTATRKAEK